MLTFNEATPSNGNSGTGNEKMPKQGKEITNYLALPSLFLLILLYCIAVGKRKVRSRTVEFLRCCFRCFSLFEFIVLLLHPYIGSWTHGVANVWMLLMVVIIAVVLVPFASQAGKWMKHRLTTKHWEGAYQKQRK